MQKRCWYCHVNSACRKRSVQVLMYGHLREKNSKPISGQIFVGPDATTTVIGTALGTFTGQALSDRSPELEYRQTKVAIPRCKGCANIHAFRQGVAVLLALIPVTVLINLGVAVYIDRRFSDFTFPMTLLIGLMVTLGTIGGWIGSWISTKLFSHIRQRSDYFEHPGIQKNINTGWYLGKQPPQEAKAD